MSKSPSNSKSPCLCMRMRRATQKLTDFYGRIIAPTKLTVNQYSLLINLSRMEGCGTGDLAHKVGQDKSTLVRTLQPLLREGLIADHSPENERKRQLYLTPKGKSVLNQAIPLWYEAQKQIAAELDMSQPELMEFFDKFDGLG